MRENTGSALIATLTFGFVLTVMMLALAVTVNLDYRMADATGRQQRIRYGMEQMAERTMARLLPEVRWDGTFDRWGLDGSEAALNQDDGGERCTVTYSADVDQIDAGVIRVTAMEECRDGAGRNMAMSYLMSPDFTTVQAIGERGEELLPEGNPIDRVAVCSRQASGGFIAEAQVRALQSGYLRLYVEGAGAGEQVTLLRPRQLVEPGVYVSAGGTATLSFVDPFEGDADRRLNVLFSRTPLPVDGRVRGECPDGSCDAIAARAVTYSLYQGCAAGP